MKLATYFNSDTGFKSRVFREQNGMYLIVLYAPWGERVPFCDRRVTLRDLAKACAIAALDLTGFTETKGS